MLERSSENSKRSWFHKECTIIYYLLGAVVRKWLSLKHCKFVKKYFFSTKLLHAHLQYVCNISARHWKDPMKALSGADFTKYSTACRKVLIISRPAWIFHFFPCNKASKLAWILRGTRGDHAGIFVWVVRNFLEKLEDGHAWCMKFAAFTWRSIFSSKFRAWNYRCLCVAGKIAWITHESCMCLAWKEVFSAHLPASRMQRNIRAFPQAVIQLTVKF